jgi:uncharacterized protein YggU (UPF0235/DUF167 family)
VKVVPKASRDRVAGWIGGRLKIQVCAPPERGRANDAVAALLARILGLPKGAVRIAAGETSPLKIVEIDADESLVLGRLPDRA